MTTLSNYFVEICIWVLSFYKLKIIECLWVPLNLLPGFQLSYCALVFVYLV